MADLALSATGDDLDVTAGELSLVEGDDAVIQQIRLRLRLFRGEWYLDARVGMPYYQAILRKGVTRRALEAIFRAAIVGTPGVASLDSFAYSLDGEVRTATIRFSCTLDSGAQITAADFGPFIVEL